jgi:ABC-2 type transport system ATP-binding protein
MIQAEHLTKTFWVPRKDPGFWASVRSLFRRERVRKDAVKDVSFRIDEGEIVGLIGANGAGKTTVVKMLAGIIHPSAGRARVLGHDPWDREDDFRRKISLIMGQKAQLWWDLPASDCFLLLREIYRVPEADFRKNLADLSALLRIEKELDVPIRRLSLGERMKMELVAALLHEPRVVFLDEPTIGLDVGAQRAVRDFLLEYRERRRPAMILTSHYMEDIERLCRRVLILRDGALVYDGPLAEVVARFADTKVVTAHLAKDSDVHPDVSTLATLGDVVSASRDLVRVRVPRARVAASASAILRAFPVADLTIEEEDIAAVVERILSERTAPAAASP